MAEESSTFIGEITDDFNYAWKFVKPRASELREYFTTSTIYKGQMVYGWVRKFPNYEDKVKEVSALTRSHATRADAESIHDTWDLKTLISKYGADATIRELKKRCDAGAVVGCSMYLNFSTHLMSTALGEETPGSKGKSDAAKDPAFRGPALGMLEVAEGSKWVNKIEALHEKYPDERIPKNEIEDLKDEFRDALEQRAGRQIPRLPGDASSQDIADSKRIAEELAKGTFIKKPQPQERTPAPAPAAMPPGPISTERIKHAIIETEEDELARINRRIAELTNKKTAKQAPITTVPHAHVTPQPKPTPIKGLDLMEDEIRQKMEEIRARRAAGQGQAGESAGNYIFRYYIDDIQRGHEREVSIEEFIEKWRFFNKYPKHVPTDPGVYSVYPATDIPGFKITFRIVSAGAGEKVGIYAGADIKKGEKWHYADLHFLIGIEQDTTELKRLLPVIENTQDLTKFDKEILKEEIMVRLQLLLEHEEVGKPRAGARCAEPVHEYSKGERIKLAKQMAEAKIPESPQVTIGKVFITCKDYAGHEYSCIYCPIKTTVSKCPHVRPAAKKSDEVRETADVITAPADYTQWSFADFEPFIRNLDDTEELRELYEFIGTSESISEKEGDTLRSMINMRIKDIDSGRK